MSNPQVPLTKAEEWTKRWQQSCPGNCKAFLIPAADLVDVLFEMAILNGSEIDAAIINTVKETFNDSKARAYMAIDMLNNGATMEKLLLVGTQKDSAGKYRDIINIFDPNNSRIYDFTTPCPPDCDLDSPLN